MSDAPTRADLLAVASFADRFADPAFTPGQWVAPATRDDGVIELGWRAASETLAA